MSGCKIRYLLLKLDNNNSYLSSDKLLHLIQSSNMWRKSKINTQNVQV